MKKLNNKFKDKCDNCNRFDYLKGYNDKCLCKKCLESIIIIEEKGKSYQLNLFKEANNG